MFGLEFQFVVITNSQLDLGSILILSLYFNFPICKRSVKNAPPCIRGINLKSFGEKSGHPQGLLYLESKYKLIDYLLSVVQGAIPCWKHIEQEIK
jgi:hypothetical protein